MRPIKSRKGTRKTLAYDPGASLDFGLQGADSPFASTAGVIWTCATSPLIRTRIPWRGARRTVPTALSVAQAFRYTDKNTDYPARVNKLHTHTHRGACSFSLGPLTSWISPCKHQRYATCPALTTLRVFSPYLSPPPLHRERGSPRLFSLIPDQHAQATEVHKNIHVARVGAPGCTEACG